MNDLSNTQLGSYQLFHVIGKGGMATVYHARQLSVGRDVAVKVLSPDLVGSEEFIARFEREARIIAGLQHPHILTVYDFGREGRLVYLVMRLLEGSLAKELATARQLPQERVWTLVSQIASALDYAHMRGIVHRDLKPTNVLLDESGSAYLTDFGIAKMMASDTAEGLTQPGSVMGTPSYMAPEQWRSEAVTGRTDIYALGIMTYQMLVGQVPFSSDTPHGLMYQHLDRAPTPPHTLNPALPVEVDRVIARALAKDPNQRYVSAPAFASDLEQALRQANRAGIQPPIRPQPDVYDRYVEHDLMSRAGEDTAVPPTMAQPPVRPNGTPPGTPIGVPSRPSTPAGQVPPTIPMGPATPAGTAADSPLDQPAVRVGPHVGPHVDQQPRYGQYPSTPGIGTPTGARTGRTPTGTPTGGYPGSAPPTGAAPAYRTGVQPTGTYPSNGSVLRQTGPLRAETTLAETSGLQIAPETHADNPVLGCLRSIMLVVIGLALFGGVVLLIALALRGGGDNDNSPGEEPTSASTAPATLTMQPGVAPSLQILAPQGEVTMGLGQTLPIQFFATSPSGVTQVELRRFSQTLDSRAFNSVVEAQGTFNFVPDSTGLHFLEIVPWSGSTRGVSVQITVRVQ